MLILGFLVDSCGVGNKPVVSANPPAAILSKRDIPDDDIEIPFTPIMAMAPDGGVAMMRVAEKKKLVFEHYSADTLGVDWSIPIDKQKGDSWDMQMQYKNGLLCCMGPHRYADGDSVAIHTMVIDPKTHTIQKEQWSSRGEAGMPTIWHPRPLLSQYSSEMSPDSNISLFYRMDNTDLLNSDDTTPKAAKMHCEMYQSDCTPKKSFDLSIPAPVSASNAELVLIHKGFKIDNLGNMYHIKFIQPDKLEVTQYPLGNTTAPVTLSASLKNCDLNSDFKITTPLITFDPVTNAMLVTAIRAHIGSGGLFMPRVMSVMMDGASRGLVHASFDFSSKQVQSFQYEPERDFLDTLIDQKTLNDYRLIKVVHDNSQHRTHIFMEKRQKGISSTTTMSYTPNLKSTDPGGSTAQYHASEWTSHTYHHPFNNCMGLLLLAFDDAGTPLWQYPLPKDQSNKIDYFLRQINPANFDIYYVDRETKLEGLQKRNFDLASGRLSQAQNILQFESDTYILTNYTLWQNPNTALMFAAGSTTWGGQLRTRNPMLFKLTTQ